MLNENPLLERMTKEIYNVKVQRYRRIHKGNHICHFITRLVKPGGEVRYWHAFMKRIMEVEEVTVLCMGSDVWHLMVSVYLTHVRLG